jgi:hypothetical protein
VKGLRVHLSTTGKEKPYSEDTEAAVPWGAFQMGSCLNQVLSREDIELREVAVSVSCMFIVTQDRKPQILKE